MDERPLQQGTDRSLAAHRGRIFRYGLAGAAGTGVHYGLLFALLGVIGPLFASTVGAAAGAMLNFMLARDWVFTGRERLRLPLPKFFAVASLGLVVNAAILAVGLQLLPVLPSQLVATGFVFLAGYGMNNIWSFRDYGHE